MNFFNKYTTLVLSSMALALSACSSISDYDTVLPKAEVSNVTFDLKDRQHPIVNVLFCINNKLDIDLPLAKVDFIMTVNKTEIYRNSLSLEDQEIAEHKSRCFDTVLKPNVNKPKVSSTLLNTIFERKFSIITNLKYDNDDVSSIESVYEGVIKE